jgi:lysophospholipase L1-like esterase
MEFGGTLAAVQMVLVLLYPQAMPAPAGAAVAWHHLQLANPFLEKMAGRFGFPILDLSPVFQQASKVHAREQLVDPLDGVHLRPMGELAVASALFRIITNKGNGV